MPAIAETASHAASSPQQLLVVGITLVGVVAVMFAIRLLGTYLAATHPVPIDAAVTPAAPPITGAVPPEIVAVIAAAAAATVGARHRIVSISPVRGPSVESLMQQWSFEGRRAIYSSHQLR